MTRYTVVWSREAQHQLADLWLNSIDRAAVTLAANEVDRTLADDPLQQGFTVGGEFRGLRLAPLRVVFLVKEADRIVEVVRVRSD